MDEIKQAWAEAVHIWKNEKPILVLPESCKQEAEELQQENMADDGLAGIIEEYLKDKERICARQVWHDALKESTEPPKWKAKKRISEYFEFCQRADRKPSVEGLALALGTTRQNLWLWEQSGGEMGEIIGRAKTLINAMLTDFAMNSKISPVFGIWLQKNHFGYSETKQIEIIPPRESHKTLEQQVTESNLVWDDETGEFIPKE